MNDAGIIDRFLSVFTKYIDSGFGLVQGEVTFIAATLIVIDITLAALFWSWGSDDDVIARLVKKTLFVGVFAYLIGNWNKLAGIVFGSFSGLGLKASGAGFSAADLLRPGKVAQTGFDAGRPLLESISGLMGYIAFFENFIQIACLMFAWAIVMLAFFILAIQLFVTLIEFKLTTLAGFVLIPFGLFGHSAFMAERVLGYVVSSGIKVLVLAVIIGIGSTLFGEFTRDFGENAPTIDDAMAMMLAALSLLGLGIFGPSIANGLVSGGPQLSAGAAIGTGVAVGGAAAAAYGAAQLGAKGAGAAISMGGAGIRSGAHLAGGATGAYQLGASGQTGSSAVTAGLGGVGAAAAMSGAHAAISPLKQLYSKASDSLKSNFSSGREGLRSATGHASPEHSQPEPPNSPPPSGQPPRWAKAMKNASTVNRGVSAAAHAVRAGDGGGAGMSVNLKGKRS